MRRCGCQGRNHGITTDSSDSTTFRIGSRRPFLLRIGVNLGDVVVEDGIFSATGSMLPPVSKGRPNQEICVFGRVQEDVVRRLDLPFEDLGEQSER